MMGEIVISCSCISAVKRKWALMHELAFHSSRGSCCVDSITSLYSVIFITEPSVIFFKVTF